MTSAPAIAPANPPTSATQAVHAFHCGRVRRRLDARGQLRPLERRRRMTGWRDERPGRRGGHPRGR